MVVEAFRYTGCIIISMQHDMQGSHLETVEQLKKLNLAIEKQYAVGRIFITGVIYGVGFVAGSTIVASMLVGILLQFAVDIPLVHDNLERGAQLIRQH